MIKQNTESLQAQFYKNNLTAIILHLQIDNYYPYN